MIESGKKLRELQEKIISGNKQSINSAIISLRNEDPFRGVIGLLSGLFDTTRDQYVKDLVRNFLNDIKEPSARVELISEIEKKYKSETTSMLVASCWQSGLDYSEYALNFSRAFITGDYIVALECFTVLEESAQYISDIKKREIVDIMNEYRESFTIEKNKLLESLIKILI
jgi:hypothetical protein